MGKRTIVFALIFTSLFSVFAETISVEAYTKSHFGSEGEYVFQSINGKSTLLSHLRWDENPLFVFGGEVSARLPDKWALGLSRGIYFLFWGIKEREADRFLPFANVLSNFTLSFSGEGAIPGSTGSVVDRDWYNNASTDSSVATQVTCFSSHDCTTLSNYGFTLTLGYEVKPENLFLFKPYVSASYYNSEHTATDGYGIYGNQIGSSNWYYPITDEDEGHVRNVNYSGKVLRLERLRYEVWAGYSFRTDIFSSPFFFTFDYAVNPFAYVESLDSHYTNTKYFYDVMSSFFKGVRFKTSFEMEMGKHLLLGLSCGYSYLYVEGSTYFSNTRNGSYSKQNSATSGADFSGLDAGLYFRARF